MKPTFKGLNPETFIKRLAFPSSDEIDVQCINAINKKYDNENKKIIKDTRVIGFEAFEIDLWSVGNLCEGKPPHAFVHCKVIIRKIDNKETEDELIFYLNEDILIRVKGDTEKIILDFLHNKIDGNEFKRLSELIYEGKSI